ncbi:hypothetical protein REH65_24780 [Saccharopolyspora sp. ID03-671]|uniref:hypothetical protein n=1 Tax=Saccharopolyspora sp. ID03-671 TaxID=3073066 RepID=UPI003250EE7B
MAAATPYYGYRYLAALSPYLRVLSDMLIYISSILVLGSIGELILGKAVACVAGAVGVGWLHVSSIVNPKETTLDHMTWGVPLAIGALIMSMRPLLAPRGTVEKEK